MSDGGDSLQRTANGFSWGNAKISAVCSDKGNRWIEVETGKHILAIRVTPTGIIKTSVRKPDRR